MLSLNLLLVVLIIIQTVNAFNSQINSIRRARNALSMEYIPDGLSKAQWADLKRREVEDKKKGLGALGVGKFKSRSFEAWQKAGGKHLFPADPTTTPYEERPYMQRKNGDWEGSDLQSKGLQGKGQGSASQRLNIDDIYEKAMKAGKLNSVSIFGGAALPWTTEAANKLSSTIEPAVKPTGKAVAAKKLSPEEMAKLKASLFKPVVSSKKTTEQPVAAATTEKKKGFFGLF